MAETYEYPITDFPNDKVALDSLNLAIDGNAQLKAAGPMGSWSTTGDTGMDVDKRMCWMMFDQALTPAQQAQLDGIVATQAGDPLYNSPGHYNVANLPTMNVQDGMQLWADDGRKPGEGAGNGTGCPIYWDSNMDAWLCFSTDQPVQA